MKCIAIILSFSLSLFAAGARAQAFESASSGVAAPDSTTLIAIFAGQENLFTQQQMLPHRGQKN